MTRRFIVAILAALLTGCSGAGVTTDDLRQKVGAEIAQITINRGQLAPWLYSVSVDPGLLDRNIADARTRLTQRHAAVFAVADLHDLRRFYSSRDGQVVVALAYAQEGQKPKADLSADAFTRAETALSDPTIAQSVSLLRTVLREAFSAEFNFE